jgi:hypothetical protein
MNATIGIVPVVALKTITTGLSDDHIGLQVTTPTNQQRRDVPSE